jgi:hypothetical protein
MTAESTPRSLHAVASVPERCDETRRETSGPRRLAGKDDPTRVSRLLVDVGQSGEGDRISLGGLLSALQHRGYGLLLILFALPNLIPNPVPGLSAIFGIPLALLSVQMILRKPHPWLPHWLASRSIKRDAYRRIVARAAPHLNKVERILRPRLPFMLAPLPMSLIAGLCLVLSLLLTLPIPLTGSPLAAPIVLFGLALIQRDGICAAVAASLGNAAMIFALAAGWTAVNAATAALPGN